MSNCVVSPGHSAIRSGLLLRRSLRLDESLGLAVGLGPVRPGALGFQAKYGASLPPLFGAVGTAVIGEHPAAGDSWSVESVTPGFAKGWPQARGVAFCR